jgi:hypothetical protein
MDVLVVPVLTSKLKTNWYYGGDAGVPEGTLIIGEVALLARPS